MPTYKVIKVNEGHRIYYQVRREDAIYPALPRYAITTCMAYGIETAQEAVKFERQAEPFYLTGELTFRPR